MTGTRRNIAYAVSVVSRNLNNPAKDDIQAVKRISRYLKGIIYRNDKTLGLECIAMLITVVIMIQDAQPLVCYVYLLEAISSTEAEIVTASETARDNIIASVEKF